MRTCACTQAEVRPTPSTDRKRTSQSPATDTEAVGPALGVAGSQAPALVEI